MKDFNLNLSDESLEFLKTNFYSSNNKSFRSCGNVWYRLVSGLIVFIVDVGFLEVLIWISADRSAWPHGC